MALGRPLQKNQKQNKKDFLFSGVKYCYLTLF